MLDEFYGTSELPQNLADTSTFFMPTELSTNHQNFVSEYSVTPGANMQTLTEEKLSSSFLPTSPEITTFGTELVDMENNRVSPTTSLFLEDFQSNVTSGETLSSPISFDMLVSSSGSFEQTLTPLQTSPLVVMTDSLTTASLLNVDTSDNEDFVSFGSSTSDSLSEFQLLGADFTTPDVVIDVSTAAPISENEGSAENSILTVEDEGSGTGTPGFLNDTAQPTQTTIPEIDLTTNGPFSSPAVSIWETFHTDGTVASSVESTSARGVSDNLIGQELANDSFASMGFSETTNLSPLISSSSEMSIASTPTTVDILSTETPSSQMPIDVTTSAGSQSTVESTTSLPSLVPNVLHLSSQSPIFDVVTVSLKPPSAYNMIASSTGVWNNTSSESPPFGSSGPSKDSLSSSPTFTTEINTPSISTYPVNSFPVSQESVTLDEFPPSSTTSRSASLPSFSSSTMAVSTTSPDTVPSSSTNSAIVTSISPTASDIPTSTTVPPIINLWNLLIARITTANGIPFLTKNVTSISSISDGITSGSHNEELKGSSTSSMPSPTENSTFVTRPFWLVTRPSGDSPLVLSTGQTFSKESMPTPVAISRTTTPTAEPSVQTSTMDSSTHSVADLILTLPVWLQSNITNPSKLTTTRLSSPKTSSTEALHDVTSESTTSTTPLPTTSSSLNFLTNLIVNGHPYIKNCTEHVVHSSSSISSVTNNVTNKIIFQMNMTADMGNQLNSSFHLEKWSEALNQFLSFSHLKTQREEIQSSAICEAAGDSILLKSLLCSNQSLSTKGERFPNLMQLIRHLAPSIIANLTTAMNVTEIQNSVNVTEFEINQTSTESTIPIPTESTTMSTLLMQRFTESFLLNLSTSAFNNVPVSPLPTVLNISLESLMENLTEQLKDTQLTDVISAVNRLSQNISEGFLESLIQNNNSNSDVFFSQPIKFESVKEDVITTQEHTSTSSTMIPTTEVHDVLQKDFWKINKRNPIKKLQRVADAGRVIPPSFGLSWRGTMKPVSSIFRFFAKPAVGRL
ncbi:serine-rich adhesin for platelets-like isoform X1 [Daphnia magna]|uniref:serine-rich adhesin for platelets-like isoform X1 n=1 Tax=Daphnia magna TaxID=35525 RepID=UPI001E1BDBF6|nr:serine-rich adhesin for platelets-like isoform X1 [Daphnia magna]